MDSKVLVIFGDTGFLGRNLVRFFSSKGYPIVGVSRSLDPQVEKLGGSLYLHIQLDFWKEKLASLVESIGVCSIINCIAMTDHKVAKEFPQLSYQWNTQLPEEITFFSKKNQIPFFQICTDGLFSNQDIRPVPRYWSLEDPVRPESEYGISKMEMEQRLKVLNWGNSLRLSFVGNGLDTVRGLISFLAKSILEEQAINGFTDVWFSPVHIDFLCQNLLTLVQTEILGFSISHMASYPALTKYDFLVKTLEVAGIKNRVYPMLRKQLFPDISAPFDQSLIADNASTQSQESLITSSAKSLIEELAWQKGKIN